jgi:hypothetical protein
MDVGAEAGVSSVEVDVDFAALERYSPCSAGCPERERIKDRNSG